MDSEQLGSCGISGMTILEHYAGLAMSGLCANPDFSETSEKEIAECAVNIAEATIAALSRRRNGG